MMENKVQNAKGSFQELSIDEFWNKFLQGSKIDPKKVCFCGELSLGEEAETSSYYILRLLSGQKTVFATSYYSFEIDRIPLPKSGSFFVVTDWQSKPYAVIEVTNVTTLPFNQVPWSIACREDEANSIEEWREIKSEFFEEDAQIMGYEFNQNMPVVFEEFKVLYKTEEIIGF
ncbi:MAG: ASCH domain-containing protein [Treponemataceae bacterium]